MLIPLSGPVEADASGAGADDEHEPDVWRVDGHSQQRHWTSPPCRGTASTAATATTTPQ